MLVLDLSCMPAFSTGFGGQKEISGGVVSGGVLDGDQGRAKAHH